MLRNRLRFAPHLIQTNEEIPYLGLLRPHLPSVPFHLGIPLSGTLRNQPTCIRVTDLAHDSFFTPPKAIDGATLRF